VSEYLLSTARAWQYDLSLNLQYLGWTDLQFSVLPERLQFSPDRDDQFTAFAVPHDRSRPWIAVARDTVAALCVRTISDAQIIRSPDEYSTLCNTVAALSWIDAHQSQIRVALGFYQVQLDDRQQSDLVYMAKVGARALLKILLMRHCGLGVPRPVSRWLIRDLAAATDCLRWLTVHSDRLNHARGHYFERSDHRFDLSYTDAIWAKLTEVRWGWSGYWHWATWPTAPDGTAAAARTMIAEFEGGQNVTG